MQTPQWHWGEGKKKRSTGIVGNGSCDVELGSSCEELTWQGTTVGLLLSLFLFFAQFFCQIVKKNTVCVSVFNVRNVFFMPYPWIGMPRLHRDKIWLWWLYHRWPLIRTNTQESFLVGSILNYCVCDIDMQLNKNSSTIKQTFFTSNWQTTITELEGVKIVPALDSVVAVSQVILLVYCFSVC